MSNLLGNLPVRAATQGTKVKGEGAATGREEKPTTRPHGRRSRRWGCPSICLRRPDSGVVSDVEGNEEEKQIRAGKEEIQWTRKYEIYFLFLSLKKGTEEDMWQPLDRKWCAGSTDRITEREQASPVQVRGAKTHLTKPPPGERG